MEEIDLSQYRCEECHELGVCQDGMEVFIACLCQSCFDRIWKEYVEAVTRPPNENEEIDITNPPNISHWPLTTIFRCDIVTRGLYEFREGEPIIMKWCWLFGHRFDIKQVGNASVKMCPRCGKSFILMERRVAGKLEDYWKMMRQS